MLGTRGRKPKMVIREAFYTIEILDESQHEDSTPSDVDFRSPRERDVGLDAWYRLVWSKP